MRSTSNLLMDKNTSQFPGFWFLFFFFFFSGSDRNLKRVSPIPARIEGIQYPGFSPYSCLKPTIAAVQRRERYHSTSGSESPGENTGQRFIPPPPSPPPPPPPHLLCPPTTDVRGVFSMYRSQFQIPAGSYSGCRGLNEGRQTCFARI